MSNELKFLIEIVKKASLMITDEFEVKAKDNKGDLVTNFDYEIEKYFINEIEKNYPEFSVVSEEYNKDESLTDNCFVIDPIDGTINFANKVPLWGIQIACIKSGKPCAAVIYLPKLNELYYADENGAFLNENRISVNSLSTKRGLYSIEDPKHKLAQPDIDNTFRKFYSASVCFSFVASGKLSAIGLVCDTPWDYIPGQYIVEKAGGVVYNNGIIHIATNNKEFLEHMLKIMKKKGE